MAFWWQKKSKNILLRYLSNRYYAKRFPHCKWLVYYIMSWTMWTLVHERAKSLGAVTRKPGLRPKDAPTLSRFAVCAQSQTPRRNPGRDGSRVTITRARLSAKARGARRSWFCCTAIVWDWLDKRRTNRRATWKNREPGRDTSFPKLFAPCCLVLFINGDVRSCSHFVQAIFHPKAASEWPIFSKRSLPVSVECASECFSKRTWSLTSRSFLSMKFPSFFQGRKKRILGKKGVLGVGSLYPRRVTSNLLNFISEFALRRYEILYNKRNMIQGTIHACHGWLFQRFFPNLRKVVEIATWLILPVAYACLKD